MNQHGPYRVLSLLRSHRGGNHFQKLQPRSTQLLQIQVLQTFSSITWSHIVYMHTLQIKTCNSHTKYCVDDYVTNAYYFTISSTQYFLSNCDTFYLHPRRSTGLFL